MFFAKKLMMPKSLLNRETESAAVKIYVAQEQICLTRAGQFVQTDSQTLLPIARFFKLLLLFCYYC